MAQALVSLDLPSLRSFRLARLMSRRGLSAQCWTVPMSQFWARRHLSALVSFLLSLLSPTLWPKS